MGKGVYVCMRGNNNGTGAIRLSVWGRQPRTHRGFDESYSAVGELRDHLRGRLHFGYQHHPFAIGDHSLYVATESRAGSAPLATASRTLRSINADPGCLLHILDHFPRLWW